MSCQQGVHDVPPGTKQCQAMWAPMDSGLGWDGMETALYLWLLFQGPKKIVDWTSSVACGLQAISHLGANSFTEAVSVINKAGKLVASQPAVSLAMEFWLWSALLLVADLVPSHAWLQVPQQICAACSW